VVTPSVRDPLHWNSEPLINQILGWCSHTCDSFSHVLQIYIPSELSCVSITQRCSEYWVLVVVEAGSEINI
jgi:hypothetical protein